MIDSLFNDYKALIEKRIDELIPQTDQKYAKVIDASRYSLMLGGKRIRPIIMIEFCRLFGGDVKDVLDFAIALEMIHTYSLIHDDLPCMDNDDIRRGKPSCHKFGEDTALLAGDGLLTEAFSIASNTKISPERTIKAINVLSKMSGFYGMLGGQAIDLSLVGIKPDIETLRDMYLKKTGCLLRSAAVIGAIIAGADDTDIEKADQYAKNTGLAFQIIDDILDTVGDQNLLGKPVGSDQKNQKTTFVTLLGIEKCRSEAEKLTNQSLEILDSFAGDTTNIKAITKYLLNRNY